MLKAGKDLRSRRGANLSLSFLAPIFFTLIFFGLTGTSARAQASASRAHGSDYARPGGEHNRGVGSYDVATPLNYALAYYKRGNERKERGDLAGALSDYTRAIDLDSNLPQVYNNRGNTLKAMGDYEAAIKDYDRAIEINPRFAFAYNNRGAAWFLKGDPDRAVSDYNKAIKLKPDYALAYANRGLAFLARGDSRRAESDFDKCSKLQPSETLCNPALKQVKLSRPMG
ncbi:MAG TPA: tetratricopeptide repeat protein [Blastocatellia bacterium]|jgi:tetratricopeptide (TPR) repeat protein|nr:tetratricopeptide repeat protein [Blastocatellia bacterium]